MALGFFRKWQKAIIVIMVVLMLSFLLGGTGMKLLCNQGSRDEARGESKYGKLMWGQTVQADADIDNLSLFLRLDLGSVEFAQLRQNGDDKPVAYALLLQEARAEGIRIGEAEVDGYLESIGLKPGQAAYRQLLGRVNKRKSGTTEPRLRAALARWLSVLRSYRAYQVASPPSEVRLRKLFRDLNETLDLRILKVPADKYTAEVKNLDSKQGSKQILDHFNKYRSARPGVYPKADSFGFGYAQPARVSVSYLLVNNDVIARVTRPRDRDVRDYFRENSKDFTKEVPVATQPGTPTTGPGAATRPKVKTRTVPMDIDEAWDKVVERLANQAAESRIEEFIQFVQASAEAQLGSAPADAELYKKVYARLIDSSQADEALRKMVPAKDIAALRGKTLDRAIPALARAAGLEAICYPWGATGEFSVSKEVRIPASLQADGPRTLAVILSDITRLVFTTAKESLEAVPAAKDKAKDAATTKPGKKGPADKAPQYPKLKWTACRGFAKILFPLGDDEGMTLVPITTKQTALVDIVQLGSNEEIGKALSSRRGRGQSLPQIAIKAKPLAPGQVMYAVNPGGGIRRILWQVIKSQPAEVLTQLNEAVRKEVVEDYKLFKAYGTGALEAAGKIAEQARTVGLEAAAKASKMETIVTAPTARLMTRSPRSAVFQEYYRAAMQQMYMGGLPKGTDPQQFMADMQVYAQRIAMMYRPFEYQPSMIEGVDLKTAAAYERFLDRVFELVPDDINKPVAPGPLGPVITIPMPTARAHFVVQRVGYMPAVAGDFENTERHKLAEQTRATREWVARVRFFGYKTILARLDYKGRRQ